MLCVLAEETSDHTQLIFTGVDPLQGRGRELARSAILPTPDVHYDWDLSPDGRLIAILKRSDATISVLTVVTHAKQTITPTGWSNLYGVSWSADARGLYVAALGEAGPTLLHVNLNGVARSMWSTKGGARAPGDVFRSDTLIPRVVPSPDARSLLIQEPSVSANIWMIENF